MLSKKLEALKTRLAGLTPKEIDRVVVQTLKDSEKLVLDLNRDQLLRGKNNKGLQVGKYRNQSYSKYKKRLNPRANGNVDLKLTGRFQREFYLRTDPVVRVWSRDLKVDPLVRKYGSSIFGLSPQSNKALARVIVPKVLKKLKQRIKL